MQEHQSKGGKDTSREEKLETVQTAFAPVFYCGDGRNDVAEVWLRIDTVLPPCHQYYDKRYCNAC